MLDSVINTLRGSEGAIALIGLVGVAFGALLTSLANRKNTYVQTIAKERILWVGELRSDLTDFLYQLEEFDYRWRYGKDMRQPGNTVENISKLKNLIRLKLNRRSELDAEIMRLMDWAEYSVGGDEPSFLMYRILLRDRISDLLKEEWEKAKLESSGAIRGLLIRAKRFGRYWQHDRRWRENPVREMSHSDAQELSDYRAQIREKALKETDAQNGSIATASESPGDTNE